MAGDLPTDRSGLARLFVALPCWEWRRGMTWNAENVIDGMTYENAINSDHVSNYMDPLQSSWRNARPDLTDPATLGAILGLLRDHLGDPTLCTMARLAADGVTVVVGLERHEGHPHTAGRLRDRGARPVRGPSSGPAPTTHGRGPRRTGDDMTTDLDAWIYAAQRAQAEAIALRSEALLSLGMGSPPTVEGADWRYEDHEWVLYGDEGDALASVATESVADDAVEILWTTGGQRVDCAAFPRSAPTILDAMEAAAEHGIETMRRQAAERAEDQAELHRLRQEIP